MNLPTSTYAPGMEDLFKPKNGSVRITRCKKIKLEYIVAQKLEEGK